MELWTAKILDHRETFEYGPEDAPEVLIAERPFQDCHTVARNYLDRRAVQVFGSRRDTRVDDKLYPDEGLCTLALHGPYGSVVALVTITRAS